MIQPVSSVSGLYSSGATQRTQAQPAAPKKNEVPQDTIHLSPAALAASGDVDHDGDSH